MDRCVVGVDLGGTKIHTALADARGTLLAEIRVPTGAGDGPGEVIRRILRTVDDVFAAGGAGKEIAALGIGAPGPLDPVTGMVHQAPNLGWKNVPLKEILVEKVRFPVLVDNDANLAALGEYSFGAGERSGHMVYVTVSTGVGGGLILDGNIYHGAFGGAGEIGHMVIDPRGPVCGCGHHGCLEALASGTAMAARARELVAKGAGKGILQEAGGLSEIIDAKTVARAAARGDGEALHILRQAGSALGVGLANVVNLLNPERVVLGGGAISAGTPLWEGMESELRCRALASAVKDLKIVPAGLGNRSGLMGAVALALTGIKPAADG